MYMKVILLQDIPKIGRKYEVKDVADGYARNFLIPREMALYATPQEVKRIEAMKTKYEKERKEKEEMLQESLTQLEGKVLTIKAKANEKGHLFAGIGKEEISAFLKEEIKTYIPAEYIKLPRPIKEIGEYKITISVGDKKKTQFTLRVEKEQ